MYYVQYVSQGILFHRITNTKKNCSTAQIIITCTVEPIRTVATGGPLKGIPVSATVLPIFSSWL